MSEHETKQEAMLERIASALERIAQSLEKKYGPDVTAQGGGTGNGPPGTGNG